MTGSHPLLYVAFGAIFLLLMAGFHTPGQLSFNNFLASPVSLQKSGEVNSKVIASETPELMLVARTGILAATPPLAVTPRVLGAIIGQLDADLKAEVTQYIVEEGDTISSLAERFGVSAETIVWANDLTASASLKPGKQLIILPVSGTLHLVRPHDTLSEIASWYQGSSQDIADFNGLASAQSLFAGDILVIPNGRMPKSLPQGRLTPLANSFFIYPIGGNHRVTQGLHAFNAIDFSNGECGESVYAAAGGTVQRAGYTSRGGNYVRILHPNGVVTYYGHLSSILVGVGVRVLQGQLVGYTGYTGYTIPRGPAGCHVHFEVRGAANPFAR